jgi:hypothetical protein
VKYLLKDTSEFPHELGFVNRSVNYIRAANWAHGSPVDRVALFATAAARAAAGDNGLEGQRSLASEASVLHMQAHLLYEHWGKAVWGKLLSFFGSDSSPAPPAAVSMGQEQLQQQVPQTGLWR